MKTLEEFWKEEDPMSNPDYDNGTVEHWYFTEDNMKQFAGKAVKTKLEELITDFEERKKHAKTMIDLVFLDGVLAILDRHKQSS